MNDPPGTAETTREYQRKLREVNEALLVSSVRQHELAEQARKAEAVLRESERWFREMVDALPAAVYTTDAHGRLTHFNPACVAFSGRTPTLGSDHRCVTWKLYYPDGRPMPHDECPMAVALKEGRIIRGTEAITERPDGTRIWFMPYPTPLRDAAGTIVGGINMLVDITQRKEVEQASARLAAIVESSDDGIVGKDLNGIITSWNVGAERLFGYTAREAVGQPVTVLVPPERLEEEAVILQHIRRAEVVEHIETIRRRKDGTLIDVSLTVSPIRDSQGTVVGASTIARDITERKHAETALRDSEERYRNLFNSMDEGYCIIEMIFDEREQAVDYRFLEVNHAFEKQSGMHDVVGKRMLEFVPDIEAHWLANYGKVALTGEAVRFENEYKGLCRWFDVYAFRVGRRHSRTVAVLFTDITARKEADRALRESDRHKSEFLAMLAHELRTPLAPILASVEIIRRAKRPEGVEAFHQQPARRPGDEPLATSPDLGHGIDHALDVLQRQVGQMVRLIDDLLDAGRISRGKIDLRRQRVELSSVVQHAVEAVRPLCERSDQELTVVAPTVPVYVDADPTRLAQIVGNLLNNACKFTDRGGRIWLTVEQAEAPGADHSERASNRLASQIVIRVRDTGIGIAADRLEGIFDMFTQIDTSLERSLTGLGIGLTLAKTLTELHGGSIEAGSAGIGHGSEFVVRLPIVVEATTQSASPPTTEPATPLRILIVDDNRDAADSLAMLLKFSGHETHTANDGMAAVEAASRLDPDVILLDIGLPRLNGYEAARRIREQRRDNGRPMLVALTGWGQDEDRRRTEEAGFDAHVVKPVDDVVLGKLLVELGAATSRRT